MAKLNLNINPSDFITQDIWELMNLEDAPQEKKDQILEDMLATIQNRVLARVLDSLQNDEIKIMESRIDSGEENAMENFLKEKSIDIYKITSEEAVMYKAELVNFIKAKRNQ